MAMISSLSFEDDYTGAPGEAQQLLHMFWNKVADNVKLTTSNDFKSQELPLARIKKIMKLDEDVKMISAEAPVLFAKAAEIFIAELTLRAWAHAEDNKRRTLQRNDIAMAISKYDQFDFLIDIVPREEIRPARRMDEGTMKSVSSGDQQLQFFIQVPQTQQAAIATTPIIQQPIQLSAVLSAQQTVNLTPTATAQPTPPAAVAQPAPATQAVQVFTQVVGANGEVQQIPIQLTQSQIQAIALQMQGKQPGQSIVIQTSPLEQQVQQTASDGGNDGTQRFSASQSVFQLPVYIQQPDESQQDGDQTQLDDT